MGNTGDLTDTLRARGIHDATRDEFRVCLAHRGVLHGNPDPTWGSPSFMDTRLVFPLYDLHGSLTGFAYRSESIKFFYSKANIARPTDMLYGLDKAYPHIAKADYAYVVEGPLDFLRVYSAGIKNVVSTLGAAMSFSQMCLLARFCKSVFLCYDPDAAGRSATAKASAILKKGGLLPIPVTLDRDPDEFINKYGAEGFRELCFQSLNNIGAGLTLRL